jgi:hypothetical protein
MNVPVCWRSKAQRGVTLSSSKAGYVAISEAVKEINFIYYLLREIGIEVNLPITVKTDNVWRDVYGAKRLVRRKDASH